MLGDHQTAKEIDRWPRYWGQHKQHLRRWAAGWSPSRQEVLLRMISARKMTLLDIYIYIYLARM